MLQVSDLGTGIWGSGSGDWDLGFGSRLRKAYVRQWQRRYYLDLEQCLYTQRH